MHIRKYNRNRKRNPKRSKGWCEFCDAAIAESNVKCPNCGKKHKTHTNKEEFYVLL